MKGLLDSKIFLVVLIIAAFVFGKAAFFMNKQKMETKKMVASVSGEYEELNKRFSDAKNDLEYMNSSTGKEKEIREKFDLGKEGEKAIFIVEEKIPPLMPKEPSGFGKFLTNVKNLFGTDN